MICHFLVISVLSSHSLYKWVKCLLFGRRCWDHRSGRRFWPSTTFKSGIENPGQKEILQNVPAGLPPPERSLLFGERSLWQVLKMCSMCQFLHGRSVWQLFGERSLWQVLKMDSKFMWQLFCMEDLCGRFWRWILCGSFLHGRYVWQFRFLWQFCVAALLWKIFGAVLFFVCKSMWQVSWCAFGGPILLPGGDFGAARCFWPAQRLRRRKNQNLPQINLWQVLDFFCQILKYYF